MIFIKKYWPCRNFESTILSIVCDNEDVDKVFVPDIVVDPVEIVANESIRCFWCICGALFSVVEPFVFDVLKLLLLIWPRLLAAFARQLLPNDTLFSNDSAKRGAV